MKTKKKAFTLIELMISVGVLAILSGVTLSVINASTLQMKARDSQRISDLKKIQTALELYYADHRVYPSSENGGWDYVNKGDEGEYFSESLTPDYISVVPSDPSGGIRSYCYQSSGSSYYLCTHLEADDTSRCGNTEHCPVASYGGFCCAFDSP